MKFYCENCMTNTDVPGKSSENMRLEERKENTSIYIRCSGCGKWFFLMDIPRKNIKLPVSSR